MGALIGLVSGVGLVLIWSAFAVPRAPSVPQEASWSRRVLGQLLARAGLGSVSVPSFIGLCVGVGAATGLVVQLISQTTPVALVFGSLASYLPMAIVAGRARRRQREFAEVWPEAVDNLASAVRAGMSLPEGLAALAERGPAPLRAAFGEFASDYQVTGRFGDSLDGLKARL
ncbi:MAG: type II secretion system F family protein, partial [Nocardioides sp.]